MGEKENQELLNYFHDRKVWMLDTDESSIHLEPYVESAP
jgi:hypothetical protein